MKILNKWWNAFLDGIVTVIGAVVLFFAISTVALFLWVKDGWNKFVDENWAGKNPADLIIILVICAGLICVSLMGLDRAFSSY